MGRRRSNYTMIEAALKNATILVPASLVPPQGRHEQAMVQAIEELLADSRRNPPARAQRRGERGGTVH
jgi:hypothetical protein